MDRTRIANHVVSEVVGLPNYSAALDATTGHPDCEAAGMILPSIVAALGEDGAAELTAQQNKGLIKQTATFEVGKSAQPWGGRRIVKSGRAVMGVPVLLDAVFPACHLNTAIASLPLVPTSALKVQRRTRAPLFVRRS